MVLLSLKFFLLTAENLGARKIKIENLF